MKQVVIGKGKLAGKGVYAARDFKTGELVMSYKLKELTQSQFDDLPKSEHMFTHSLWGKIHLYPEPARYVNHSPNPNTRQDLEKMCEYATRPIKKGEMITTNATLEVETELKTFLETMENTKINEFKRISGGYRNSVCIYKVGTTKKTRTLKRINGNWQIV